MIAAAAAAGARLICLTEMYATGFSMRPERIAEDEGGPNEQFLLDQARRAPRLAHRLDRPVGRATDGPATMPLSPRLTAMSTGTRRSTRSATPANTSITPPATSS